MIARYTREPLGRIWSEQRKLEAWLEVELAVCDVLAERGVIPASDHAEIRARAAFDLEAVKERERVTNHDVAAFVDVVSQSVGPAGRFIHYGLTSYDVVDTGLALLLRGAGEEILSGTRALVAALARRAREFSDTICVGRTHGVHAEPTSFGLKLAGFAFEQERSRQRLERAFDQVAFGKLSGAVGTYSALDPDVEREALERLGLRPEPLSTQVVPRDRHADLLATIAVAASSLDRLALEIRHLQRTEVREVEEPFAEGQKGSSAMPHKRNPVVSERICGIARVLRGYAQPALEDVALWHERDISHSSAERILLPGSTTLLDFAQHDALRVVDGMRVYPERMRENLDMTHGALFSQALLTALVESGIERDEAYRVVQSNAQRAWDERVPLRSLVEQDPVVSERLDAARLDELFDFNRFLRHVPVLLERLEALETRAAP